MVDAIRLTSNKDALFARLRKLVPGVEAQMGKANLESANEMASLARGLAPTGASRKLKASIRIESGPRPGSYRVAAGGAATTKNVRAGSGKPFDYSLGIEFGTKPHVNSGIFAGSQNPGVRRHSFFWSAYRLMRKKIRSRASRAIGRAIKAI